MAIFKCKMCGGTVEFEQGASIGVCDSCGTKQTLPKISDDTLANLFNRANNLRLKCEFDKAAAIYEKIVEQDDAEAEAHWGIVLCKYGIEYVDDPATGKKIPTCHRTLFDAVTADADYQAAIDYSDTMQQALYETEARAIDRIQKDILAIVKNEKPFDVFICYKETDENGKRTQDSVIANDIYYQLTQEGFKVFYAAITLEDKLGQEYEPYIFAALNSAKVMLVVGTDPMYFNAVWVRNEWSRYLKLMKTDRNKLLIPCYRDMDAYELPEEFAHLQAQDMSKIGFINDIVRGIKKVISTGAPSAAAIKETVSGNTSGTNIAPLLKRAFMFLEDGEFARADEFCEQVLNLDPENAQAYLGKLMAELKVKKQEDLKDCAEPFDGRNNYQKAVRFGNTELPQYIAQINERNELARLSGIYNNAKNHMNMAKSESDFKSAAQFFQSIPGFKDADALTEQCLEKAKVCHKDSVYKLACSYMAKETISLYESAIKTFQTIPGWKDVDEQIYACQRKIEEIKAKEEADRMEAARKAEERRIAVEKAKKKRKKIIIIAASIIATCIAFVIVLTTVIIPNNKYNAAVALMNEGRYQEAIVAFEAMGGYKDSTEQITECRYCNAISLMNEGKYNEAYAAFKALNNYKDSLTNVAECLFPAQKPNLSGIQEGDTIKFGAYEQDNSIDNGKEEIEWIVLNVVGNRALVISKYALDCQQYNTSYTDVTWETCTLRKWLNDIFLNTAFGAKHQELVPSVSVSADKNPKYSTDPGNATTDKVFLLSIAEAEKYFTTDESRKCAPTAFAKAQGAFTSDSYKTASGEATCWWWLRSPGYNQVSAAGVYLGGSVDYFGSSVNCSGYYVSDDSDAVRPALWIDLSS